MKLTEIIEIIESEFPTETAYDWDNCGLLIGEKERDIKKVLVTLDVTEKTVNEAIIQNADLILSHHPIMLSPIKRITNENSEGRLITKAIENKISMYAAHTNCDVGKRGINARLAEIFELTDAEPVEENGLGRIGNLKKEITLEEFAKIVKERLNTPFVRVCGDIKSNIKRVAVGSGACSDIIPVAIEKGADVMVTGDTKYHNMMSSCEMGINIIDAGHYPTEIIVMDIFEELLKKFDIEIIKSKSTDVFNYI